MALAFVRPRHAIAAGALLLAAILGGLTAPAAWADGGEPVSVKVLWTGKITVTGPDGNVLGTNATLHRGDAAHVDITKLGPDEQVSVTLHSSNRDLGLVRAGDDGAVSYDFTVPTDLSLGVHTLTFTGVTSDAAPRFAFVVSSSGGGDNGGTGDGSGSDGGSGSSGNGDGLASTGEDLLALLVAAGGLIGLGVVLTLTGRGRSRGRPA